MAANPDEASKQIQQLSARVSQVEEIGKKRVEALNTINKKTYDHFIKLQARIEQLEKRVDKVVSDLNSALQNAHKFDKGLEARITKLEKSKR